MQYSVKENLGWSSEEDGVSASFDSCVCDGNTSNKLLHVKCCHPDVSITCIEYYVPTVLNKLLNLKANMDKDRTKATGVSFFFFFVNRPA